MVGVVPVGEFPYAMTSIKFDLSEMRELGGEGCYHYVDKKLRAANAELQAFVDKPNERTAET